MERKNRSVIFCLIHQKPCSCYHNFYVLGYHDFISRIFWRKRRPPTYLSSCFHKKYYYSILWGVGGEKVGRKMTGRWAAWPALPLLGTLHVVFYKLLAAFQLTHILDSTGLVQEGLSMPLTSRGLEGASPGCPQTSTLPTAQCAPWNFCYPEVTPWDQEAGPPPHLRRAGGLGSSVLQGAACKGATGGLQDPQHPGVQNRAPFCKNGAPSWTCKGSHTLQPNWGKVPLRAGSGAGSGTLSSMGWEAACKRSASRPAPQKTLAGGGLPQRGAANSASMGVAVAGGGRQLSFIWGAFPRF